MPSAPSADQQGESSRGAPRDGGLVRGIGLVQATSLNVANMVGVGPFITIPFFVAAMGGPQALVAWIIAAVLVLCDGLVWSELGAAMPGSGGSYHFLREIYGRYAGGRLIAFLFIWQFLISGSLELASGYIGASNYLAHAWPQMEKTFHGWGLPEQVSGVAVVAALASIVVAIALCRHIASLAWLAVVLCAGTLVTTLIVIVSGVVNFDSSLLTFPPEAFQLNRSFFTGLGGAMLIAIYDYLGYYNVCHLGDEVIRPETNIPRAVIISVILVAGLYLTMNIAMLGVVPWQSMIEKVKNDEALAVGAEFMEIIYGRRVAVAFTGLIIWTALASVFVMTLGYSRILYAAARNGDFFRVFGYLHPTGHYPPVAVLTVGAATAVCCFFPLGAVIEAAVIVRIFIQFLGQILGLHIVRTARPDIVLPFRMWLYPLPSLVAVLGWLFVVTTRLEYWKIVLAVFGSGIAVYVVRQLWRECR
jgi:amino acid transporter